MASNIPNRTSIMLINQSLPFIQHAYQTTYHSSSMVSPNIHLTYMSWHQSIHHSTNPNHTANHASSQTYHHTSKHASLQTPSLYPRQKHMSIKDQKQKQSQSKHVIIQSIKITIIKPNHVYSFDCMTYLYLPCSYSAPMALCISM